MIECSICSAINEDRSLFCSECGQRLGAKSSAGNNSSDQSTSGGLLQTPKLDAVPSHPSFKLHSPILDLGANEKNHSNRKIGSSGVDDEYEGTTNQDSSVRNANSISRNGLHSPLLDGRENKSPFPRPGNFGNHNSKAVPPADLISQISSDPSTRSSLDPGQQGKPRRSNQGLRSPLLGGGADYEPPESSDPPINDMHGMSSRLSNNEQSIRLHSPVLDGPAEVNRRFVSNEQSEESSDEEYDSLRSPILAAKVRLPEKNQLPADPNLSGLPLNQGHDPLSSQPTNLSLSQFPDDKNFSEFKAEAQNTSAAGQQTIQSILNTGVVPAAKTPSQPLSSFSPLLFDQSQTETGDKPVVAPGNKPIYFSGLTDANKSNSASSSRTMPAVNVSEAGASTGNKLPGQTEFVSGKTGNPFYKVMVIIMIVATIAFKFCYLQALGNTIFSSIPFLLDQIGQILVMLAILFLALTAKF